jgi:serine/threonine protein phosphatase PrpC
VLARPPLFVVTDGMGGHAAGEVASAMVVETFEALTSDAALTSDDIVAALARADTAIVSLARRDPSKAGMGATAVGLTALQQGASTYWLVFNVGDSRLYRYQRGELTQITVDHSYVQELIDLGRLSPTDARSHPERSVITRVLGSGLAQSPDFWLFPPELGERFLLCSDGLSSEVDDEAIRAVLAIEDSASAIANRLVQAALHAGGHDNVSAIVVDVTSLVTEPDLSDRGSPRTSTDLCEDTQDGPRRTRTAVADRPPAGDGRTHRISLATDPVEAEGVHHAGA